MIVTRTNKSTRTCSMAVLRGPLVLFLSLLAVVFAVPFPAWADGTLTAKVDGGDWKADDVISTYTAIGGHAVFNLSARAYRKPTQFFSFNLLLPADHMLKGTIVFDRSKPLEASTGNFVTDPDPSDILNNSYPFQSGQVVIETYDAAHKTVDGTFSGSARNRAGKVLTITGRFAGVSFDPAQVK
jgi:hypothetical protein